MAAIHHPDTPTFVFDYLFAFGWDDGPTDAFEVCLDRGGWLAGCQDGGYLAGKEQLFEFVGQVDCPLWDVEISNHKYQHDGLGKGPTRLDDEIARLWLDCVNIDELVSIMRRIGKTREVQILSRPPRESRLANVRSRSIEQSLVRIHRSRRVAA